MEFPQGTITTPLLFKIFIADQPIYFNTSVGDYVDDKVYENPIITSNELQSNLSGIQFQCKNLKVKINKNKSSRITFTLKQGIFPRKVKQHKTVTFFGPITVQGRPAGIQFNAVSVCVKFEIQF